MFYHMKLMYIYSFMVTEVFPDQGTKAMMDYYHSGSDMPFNFNLLFMNRSCGGLGVKKLVQDWLENMPDNKWPNWVVSPKLGTCVRYETN